MGLLDLFSESTPEQKQQEIRDFNMTYSQPYYDQQMAQQQQDRASQWIRDNQDLVIGAKASAPRLSDRLQEQLGSEDPSQPWANELKTVPAQEATGFEAGEPTRAFLERRNAAMMGSGIPSLMEQGMSNSRGVMDSVNSQINTIAGKRFDVNNRVPAEATSPYTNVYTSEDGTRWGFNKNTGKDEPIPDSAKVRNGQQQQMSVYDDENNLIVQMGEGGGETNTAPTKNKLQAAIFDATGSLDMLNRLHKLSVDVPKTYWNKFKSFSLAEMEKLGKNLNKEDQKAVGDYTRFRAVATRQVAAFVKSISGATVTPQEYERLNATMPNADMSHTEFQSALDETIQLQKMIIARAVHSQRLGLDPKGGKFKLDSMEQIMDQRLNDLMKEYDSANPDADKKTRKEALRVQMNEEFGGIY